MKLKRIVSSLMALAVTASCLLATGISVEAESTVTGITLNETEGYFNVGTPLSFFTASVAPEGADAVELVWESDNPGIFTVDQQGVITGVSEGTANLTVRAGGASATAIVNVVSNYSVDTNRLYEHPEEATPKMTQANTELCIGDYKTANFVRIDFTCIDDGSGWGYYAIALKDGSGNVKSVHLSAYPYNIQPNSIVAKTGFSYYCYIPFTPGAGDFSIYRMYNNGGDFEINSVKFISSSVTGVTLSDDTPLELDVKPGSTKTTAQLTATVEPTTAPDKSVTWSSTNPAVASVDQSGKVKAHSIGTTIIRATSNSNSMFSDECTVTVIDSTPESRKIAYIDTHSLDWTVHAYQPKHSVSVEVKEDNKKYTVSVKNTTQNLVQLELADLVILNAADENFELLEIKLNGDSVGISDWTQLEEWRPDNNNQWIRSKVIKIPAETFNTWPPLQSGKSIEFVFKRASEEPNDYVKFNTGAGTNGAQVRLKTDYTAANEDLRFKFSYDVTDLPKGAEISEYGFIYASGKNFKVSSVDAVESLDLNTFTLSEIGSNQHVYNTTAVNYRDEVEKGRTVRYSNIVLTGIQDGELEIYYLARPYVTYTLGGKTYTEYGDLIARSVYYVAKECYNQESVDEDDRQYLLKRILNKVNAEE